MSFDHRGSFLRIVYTVDIVGTQRVFYWYTFSNTEVEVEDKDKLKTVVSNRELVTRTLPLYKGVTFEQSTVLSSKGGPGTLNFYEWGPWTSPSRHTVFYPTGRDPDKSVVMDRDFKPNLVGPKVRN